MRALLTRSAAARTGAGPRARHTVRFRLTLVYGGLFLLAGTALLVITYILVVHATGQSSGAVLSGVFPPEGESGFGTLTAGGPSLNTTTPDGLTPDQLQVVGGEMIEFAQAQHRDLLHQVLIQGSIALGLTAAASIGLGWVVAGRILRPVRTIVDRTRRISAHSLHARLNLAGPDDEIKELGATIDALLARLEATFQAQRQFIANASHELRTPLARQRLLSQVALADPEASVASLREAHERVIASGEQQNRLIESLLTLARGQAGLDTRAPFDLAELAAAALNTRHDEAAARELKLEAELGPAVVAGSSALTESLVANLLDNALRYNAPGGRVTVRTEAGAGGAVLTVANTGPQIPAADVARLTRPFQRLGASRIGPRRAEDGLGLGLSIVEAVAGAHGAVVELRPRLEGGLLARIRFPAPAAAPVTGS